MAPPRALSDYYPSGRRRGPSPLELAARRPHAREGAGQARGPAFGGGGAGAAHARGELHVRVAGAAGARGARRWLAPAARPGPGRRLPRGARVVGDVAAALGRPRGTGRHGEPGGEVPEVGEAGAGSLGGGSWDGPRAGRRD